MIDKKIVLNTREQETMRGERKLELLGSLPSQSSYERFLYILFRSITGNKCGAERIRRRYYEECWDTGSHWKTRKGSFSLRKRIQRGTWDVNLRGIEKGGEHASEILMRMPLASSLVPLGLVFRATLNFRKFKVALNPMYRYFFELCQKLHLILFIKIL